MQKKFLLKLTLFMVLGMTVITLAIFFTQHYICKENTISSSKSTLEQITNILSSNDESAANLRRTLDSNALAKARAFSEMIQINPDILEDFDKLCEIATLLDVDELHVTDENGVLLWGTVKDFYGFNFDGDAQAGVFMDILDDSSLEIAQDPTPNGATGTLFQYVSVARRDQKGIVQVGLSPEVLDEALKNNSISKIFADHSLGLTGFLFAIDTNTGEILAHGNTSDIGKLYTSAGFDKNVTSMSSDSFIYTMADDDSESEFLCTVIKNGDNLLGLATPTASIYLQRNNQTFIFFIAILIVFALLILIINLILKFDIVNKFDAIISTLRNISGGNLNVTADVRTNKEFIILSDSINDMVTSIKNGFAQNEEQLSQNNAFLNKQSNIFNNIKNISNHIKDYSEQTLSISNSIYTGSVEQARCVQEVNQTMDILSTRSDHNSKISKKVSEDAYASSERVASANASMKDMQVAMQEIASTSEHIRSIIGNINNIASQTNMLALNASIEAARAGEAGKSFAVVATQVSDLAAQSTSAASETSELIQNALEAIEKGNTITEKATADFIEITEITSMVSSGITELSNSFNEELELISNMSDGISQISQIADTNSGIASESEHASRILADQAEELNRVIIG